MEYTSRAKMEKPEDGEFADQEPLNRNFDKIDKKLGSEVCTSTTRPANPYIGQKIYETDTQIEFIYTGVNTDGSPWRRSGGAAVYAHYRRNAEDAVTGTATNPFPIPNSTWTMVGSIGGKIVESNGDGWGVSGNLPVAPRFGRYLVEAHICFARPADGTQFSGNTNISSLTRVGLGVTGYDDADLSQFPISGLSSDGGSVIVSYSGIVTFNAASSKTAKVMAYQSSGGALVISNVRSWIKLVEL